MRYLLLTMITHIHIFTQIIAFDKGFRFIGGCREKWASGSSSAVGQLGARSDHGVVSTAVLTLSGWMGCLCLQGFGGVFWASVMLR